jgi:hypothetical protein
MTYAEAQSELDIDLNDSDDFTFTPEEKQRALTQAWDDPFNVSTAWDESLVYDQATYQYARPSGVTFVKSIYYKTTSEPFPVRIDTGNYESVNTNIYFTPEGRYVVPQGATLIVRGTKQLTTADTVADDRKEYVLKVARYNLLSMLGGKKVNKFLQNDTTTAEIMAMRQTLEREIAQMRKRFTQAPEVF